MLKLRKFFAWLCLPPEKSRRPACSHCGGIRCFGTCQFDGGKAKNHGNRKTPPDEPVPQ
jgi:hypothetical protein